jgi:hypothetical protein
LTTALLSAAMLSTLASGLLLLLTGLLLAATTLLLAGLLLPATLLLTALALVRICHEYSPSGGIPAGEQLILRRYVPS